MAGAIKMTPDITVAQAGQDSRDFWRKDQRIAIASDMWRRHNLLNPYAEQVNLGFTTCLISGDKGWGKSLLAVDIGVQHTEEGFRVIHNMADAAFGYFLEDPRDFYLLAERGIPPMVAIMDEAHMMASKYGQGSHRNQLLQQTLSMSRKRGIPFYFVSQQENAISYDLRAEVDWLIYPVPAGVKGNKWDPEAFHKFKYKLPPWAYMTTWTYGPKPWGTKFYAETMGGSLRPTVKRYIERRDPYSLLRASAVYNTFETFKLGAAFELGAAAMREAIEDGRVMEFAADVPNAGNDEPAIDDVLNDLGRLYLLGSLDPYEEYESWETVEDAMYQAAQEFADTVKEWSASDLAYAFGRKVGMPNTQGFNPNRDLKALYAPFVDKMQEAWIEMQSRPANRGGGFRERLQRR